jgi:hypothetical protein
MPTIGVSVSTTKSRAKGRPSYSSIDAQRFVEAAGAQGRVEVIAADAVREPLTLPCDVAIMRAFLQVLSRGQQRRRYET